MIAHATGEHAVMPAAPVGDKPVPGPPHPVAFAQHQQNGQVTAPKRTR